MHIQIFSDAKELAQGAAIQAADEIQNAIRERGHAWIIAATGVSQIEFLDELTSRPGIDWSQTTFFHLDEYVGLPEDHPAGFRRYLRERIVDRIHPGNFVFANGNHTDPQEECRRLGGLISGCAIDVAFVGIGENGHLAFNDPPADFETHEPFIVVELDEACRRQQLGEGWFESLDAVPRRAISMSINEILRARTILCMVPEKRKAEAVRNCLEKAIDPMFPASALRQHPNVFLYLDEASGSLLSTRPGRRQ